MCGTVQVQSARETPHQSTVLMLCTSRLGLVFALATLSRLPFASGQCTYLFSPCLSVRLPGLSKCFLFSLTFRSGFWLAGWFSVLPLTPPAAAFRHLHCAAPGTNHNIPSTQTILGTLSFHFQFQLLELQFPSRCPQPPDSFFNFALPSFQCFPGLVRSTLLWMRSCCIAGSESLACEHA